ncbi:MAG TPA: iron-containing redox enzyme family protein [Xanthomonadales bacterium]|nr:iron-containing redox enzyme family protein [Xanthomonadales bacterium]
MNFFDTLQDQTESARIELVSSPIIQRALSARITLPEYAAFLNQAYQHVRHTVPLLMATGARLPERYSWMQSAVAEYIEEEIGHEEWILNDLEACGFDRERARSSRPSVQTELMVSYAYDMINRVNPLGFFGMVHVLEGTSVSIADHAADSIRESLSLPKKAFSYLYSHGALDLEHIEFFKTLMNRIEDPADQAQIVHAANVFYGLYGNIFRALDSAETPAMAA